MIVQYQVHPPWVNYIHYKIRFNTWSTQLGCNTQLDWELLYWSRNPPSPTEEPLWDFGDVIEQLGYLAVRGSVPLLVVSVSIPAVQGSAAQLSK